MTTIVASAKEGVLVCDSRVQTDSSWWPGQKVVRVGRALIGGAGDASAIKKFIAWYGTNRTSRPRLGDNFVALTLTEEGLFYWCQTLIAEPIARGFHAVGSGGNAALGAMLAGANCHEAVRIACQIDTCSGGEIFTHKLVPNDEA